MSSFVIVVVLAITRCKVEGLNTHVPDKATEIHLDSKETVAPYHLQLRYYNRFICDAALLLLDNSRQIVVTSGTCVTLQQHSNYLLDPDHLAVFAGKLAFDVDHLDDQHRSVWHIVRHPDWNKTKTGVENDIAVVLMRKDFVISDQVQPLKLKNAKRNVFERNNLLISAWTSGGIVSKIVSTENIICSSKNLNIRFCTPRVVKSLGGSPAAYTSNGATSYLAGIFSFDKKDLKDEKEISVFVNVTQYTNWIRQVAVDSYLMTNSLDPSETHTSGYSNSKPKIGRYAQANKHVLKRSLRNKAMFRRSADISPRIFGGRPAKPFEAPYHMQIFFDLDFICSGVLVQGSTFTYHYVLTVADCVTNPDMSIKDPTNMAVYGGVLETGVELCYFEYRYVTDIIRYPTYRSHDIAILILDKQFLLNHPAIQPTHLPPRQDFYPPHNAPLTMAGWGSSIFKDEKFKTPWLQIMDIQALPWTDCYNAYYPQFGTLGINDTHLCAWDESTGGINGVCQGDQGGGAITTDHISGLRYVAGLYTWGSVRCGNYKLPSVYLKVSAVLNWIQFQEKANKHIIEANEASTRM